MAMKRSPGFCLKLIYRYLLKADHFPGDTCACHFWPQGHNHNKLGRSPVDDAFFFVSFDSLRPLNNLSVMRDGSSWVEPVLSLDKCVLLKDQNAVTPVRLEPAALRSRVKHSTTEPLRSLH